MFTGEANFHYVPHVICSGFIPTFSGAAESITVNPEEKQMLFAFTGAVSQTTTVVPPEGFGTLFGFSGASITTRSAYETQGLYQISGDGHITASLLHIGSGTFRKFAGAAESLTVNPEEKQMLFSFFGSGGESHTEDYVGSYDQPIKLRRGALSDYETYDWQPSWVSKGGITIRREEAKTHWVPHIIGTGTFRKFAGAAESLTVNPEERQLLFSFTGEHQVSFTANPPEDTARVKVGSLADTRFIPKYPGSGEIYLAGIADTRYVPVSYNHLTLPTKREV